ncbi:MAG TPA: HEAT repeat domain-containing protein [Dehalococcoidales bacterium]
MPIKNLIEEIANTDKPLMSSHLADLSQMTIADMPILKRIWGTIETTRRRQIISRLTELAKDNVELNFDLIFKHGLSDPDAEVRVGVIDGLLENEDPSLIKIFIDLLRNDISYDVQASAAAALGKFAVLFECEEIRQSYKTTLSQALLAIINDINKPVEVRRRALESVAPLSIPAVREAIKKAYESRDERFTVSAIYAMGRTRNESWLPVLYKEMANADAEIRYEAAGACGEIGIEEAVPHLLERIHDPDIEVRMMVIQSLGKIGGIEAKKGLQRIARDENRAIREAVEQALSGIETMEDMTLLEMDIPGEQYDKRN